VVAYSFKHRFVTRIRIGLDGSNAPYTTPKRQTIRAPRKRHAREGEEVQLYHAMRTKQCFLIGRGTCVDVTPITLRFYSDRKEDSVACSATGLLTRSHLDQFAKLDGFIDWEELRQFWREEHPGVDKFEGFLIRWEPIRRANNERDHNEDK